jgi:hypothetical protein
MVHSDLGRVCLPMFLLAEINVTDVQLYTGIFFAVAVFIALLVIFFTTPVLTDDQRRILRFFCAFMAGCSGAFLSGDALFDYTHASKGTKIAVQGTAGCALFFCVWFTFEPLRRKSGVTACTVSIPDGGTFESVAVHFGKLDHVGVDLSALTLGERAAPLREARLEAKTALDILAKLHAFAKPPAHIRPYRLERDGVLVKLVP